jgi:replication-associated recombination protein RarA
MFYFKDQNDGFYAVEDLSIRVPEGAIQITQEEAEAIIASNVVPLTYAQKRASEYPPYTDYLDGIAKGDQTQIDKYIADCQAVKAKYPKP